MLSQRRMTVWVGLAAVVLAGGCAAPKIDFSTISRPVRASELEAYNVFVGSWTWSAALLNADEPDRSWTGTAKWDWTLDKRCLIGEMSAKSGRTNFTATGIWSWHPRKKKYIWWMFNNWGFPQEGSASYNTDTKTWHMDYRSVGLDGTTSYGRYRMTVIDQDTLEWELIEWATPLHLVKKMEMKGTYKRQS